MTRPTVTLVADLAHIVDAPAHIVELSDVPAQPFRLDGVVVRAHVATPESASEVLLALVRGASVVVRLDLEGVARASFVDDAGRVASVLPAVEGLSDDQRRLLELLGAGRSLGDAADRLGWSRRTADRRLARARVLLGVTTTAEAVASFAAPLRLEPSAEHRDRR